MATRNLTRKFVDIRNAQKANRVTGFHTNNVKVIGGGAHEEGGDDSGLLGSVESFPLTSLFQPMLV